MTRHMILTRLHILKSELMEVLGMLFAGCFAVIFFGIIPIVVVGLAIGLVAVVAIKIILFFVPIAGLS